MQNTSLYTLFTTTIGGALLITAPVFAQDATQSAAPSEPPPATIDTDGDGTMDAWDQRGDGKPDTWDTDGDGMPDAFDVDGDGAPDPKPDAEATPDPD